MKRLVVLLAAFFSAAFPVAAAAADSRANGGGRGTVDGVNPFSQFGFGVTFSDGGVASGNFNCLMAGSAAFPGFEPLMKVSGAVLTGTATPSLGVAEFTGSGTLNLGPSGRMPATFVVTIKEGGPGVGKLHLTVLTPPFPVPEETVLAGFIKLS